MIKRIGDPLDMFNHAYKELPTYLQEQREELVQELAEMGKEEHHG